MIELAGRDAYVIGLGSHGTGREVARALLAHGARVTVADRKPRAQLTSELAKLEGLPVTLELGDEYGSSAAAHDLVILSPGVPLHAPPVRAARAAGAQVMGELELAWHLCPAPIVAITGTKGKTTTTTLTGRLLAAAGQPVLVGGNIGDPLVGIAERARPNDLVVAEVSSFLLEGTRDFRAHVGLLLNLYEDHLDRHGSMEEYLAAKARLFANQDGTDFAVLNADQPLVAALARGLRARVLHFGLQPATVAEGATVVGETICAVRGGKAEPICPVSALQVPGRHNLANALAAICVLLALDLPLEGTEQALREFPGVPNRLERVAEVGGVLFVNDSQGTAKQAVACALEAFAPRRTVLIAGGRAKVADFADLARVIAARASALVVIGEAAQAIAQAAGEAGLREIQHAPSLPQAVAQAYALARPDGVVLLSPACASFDMFENMEHRGQVFRQAVADLKRTEVPDAA